MFSNEETLTSRIDDHNFKCLPPLRSWSMRIGTGWRQVVSLKCVGFYAPILSSLSGHSWLCQCRQHAGRFWRLALEHWVRNVTTQCLDPNAEYRQLEARAATTSNCSLRFLVTLLRISPYSRGVNRDHMSTLANAALLVVTSLSSSCGWGWVSRPEYDFRWSAHHQSNPKQLLFSCRRTPVPFCAPGSF